MGKSRSNAEYMQTPQPTATERLQKALNRPVNEAINIPSSPATPGSTLDKGLDANRESNASKGRGQYVNDMVDKASR